MSGTNFGAKTTALEVVKRLNAKLDGKVVLITGATSGKTILDIDKYSDQCLSFFQGIGVETARALASTNAHVIITGRDMNRGIEVVEDIKKSTGNNKVEVMKLDLTSLMSVRTFVDHFRARKLPIKILICKF